MKTLFWLSVVLPLAFIVALGVLLEAVLKPALPDPWAYGVAVALAAEGVAAYAYAVFRRLGHAQERLRVQADELQALYEAGMTLSSELSLESVLRRLVDLARGLTGARYGAMSVLGDEGIQQFIHSGLSDEEVQRMGDPPKGKGLLGVILREGVALRLDDLAADERSVGFPPQHPQMRTLLGVPVVSRGRLLGNLYLTEKAGGRSFDERDEELVRHLAAQAAVAAETSELYEQLKSLALLQERERIGMDLHDGIIQSIYAVELALEGALERLEESPREVRTQLDRSIDDLNRVIEDIRSYIFDLRPQVSRADDLGQALAELADQVKVNTLMQTEIRVPPELPPLDDDQARGLFHVAQEALNNVARHSRASSVTVDLSINSEALTLEVRDDGVGFDPEANGPSGTQGLRNMSDRARGLGARLAIDSAPGEGTRVHLRLPLLRAQEAGRP